MSLLKSLFSAIVKGADASSRGLEGVTRSLDAYNGRMARQLRVHTVVRDLDMAIRLERACIEESLKVAEMTYETEKKCQDPAFRRAYAEAQQLLGRNVAEPALGAALEPSPIPAFAISIASDHEDIRAEVEDEVALLRSRRDAFLAATRERLLADPGLRGHFESAMDQMGGSHLLSSLQLPTDESSVTHMNFGPIYHSSTQ